MIELFLDNWGGGPMVSMRVDFLFSIKDYSKFLSESGEGTLFKRSPGCIEFYEDLDWVLRNDSTGGGFIRFNEEYNKSNIQEFTDEDYLLEEKELVLFQPFLSLGFLYCSDYELFVKSIEQGDEKTVEEFLRDKDSFFGSSSIFVQGPKCDSRFKEEEKIKINNLKPFDIISNVVRWDKHQKNEDIVSYDTVLCKMSMVSNYVMMKRNVNPFLELKKYDS